jgi:orotidine-5'-phosphate decarboxylase
VGVTVLTSLKEKDLKELGLNRKVEKQVKRLAIMAADAGLDGAVASAQEIEVVRKNCGKKFTIVTPGIRPKFAALNDQKRVMTPAEAIEKGADYLVIGRPIIEANDPPEAASQIISEIENG